MILVILAQTYISAKGLIKKQAGLIDKYVIRHGRLVLISLRCNYYTLKLSYIIDHDGC